MSSSVTVSEARATLPQILERVLAGDEVTLTRHGQPVAVVVRPDALRTRRAAEAMVQADAVTESLRAGRTSALEGGQAITEARAAAIVADVHAGRAGRG